MPRVLDVDVRALGSAFRVFGLADAKPTRQDSALAAARNDLVVALPPALARGKDEVLALRAWQLRAFLRAVRHWETTGEVTEELLSLAGDFPGLMRRSGWVEPEGRRLRIDDVALTVLFKKRWNRVVGVQGADFEPTLDEERALYQFLLRHPAHDASALTPSAPLSVRAVVERRADEYRLKKITELAALDSTYPRELARGVVLYRLGQYEAAIEAFRRHLDAHADGPYTIRARNYLRASLEQVNREP
ncbi:tetratricopeptide repeat protein [Chondromyces crocatus]|uniref:Tetratricopeptide repeat protein n=1 Tax=Chondromyces crocatus TaxID=52 RepID=A0A0K1EQM4_CHOCO|nr:tetratricopeptide repeat protein [Chondromyces crocatus]AKT43136.1 uncharacterized protein CMC5_073640 [Chondromyces crocatus]